MSSKPEMPAKNSLAMYKSSASVKKLSIGGKKKVSAFESKKGSMQVLASEKEL